MKAGNTSKHIVLFGAGKSATVLIGYLAALALEKQWQVTVADGSEAAVRDKAARYPSLESCVVALEDAAQRQALIEQSDLVISLMPPALHILIARDCVAYSKHLLTASYVDDQLRALEPAIREKGLLFLCEMGLDPGIDHMSAMQLLHRLEKQQASVFSFQSHCGGLVAPDSDTNPWHYKISWNPRNVVIAGKAGAVYRENGHTVQKSYPQLFEANKPVTIPDFGTYACYPNRDSLSYLSLYHLPQAQTFVRTTLRHPAFCTGWRQIIAWQLTDEEKRYQTDGLSLRAFFAQHFKALAPDAPALLARDNDLQTQLAFLGLYDDQEINKGYCSAAEVLQFILEQRLALQPADKDLVLMMHEIGYTFQDKQYAMKSWLIVTGEDAHYTAMAKTVGLPLGIAARLLLEGTLTETGLHIPVLPSIYTPVLQQLERHGVVFHESNDLIQ